MKDLNKNLILNILKIAIGVLGALFVILAVVNLPGDIKNVTVSERTAIMNNSQLGLMTNFTIFVIFLGALMIVGFFLYGLVTDTKKTLKSVIGYLLSGVVFFIMYALAKGTTTPAALKHGVETSALKATEAGLYLTIVMVAIGFILMLVGPLFRYLKK